MPITNFEEITETLNERELELIPYFERAINKFKTNESAIKSQNLCDMINHMYVIDNGFNYDNVIMTNVRLRKFVNFMRKNGKMPIIATSDGYFVTENKEELEKQIKSLTERANGILAAADGLKKFLL